MHDLDLQQLAEAAMLQQAHEGDAQSHGDAGQTRSNPRRSVTAGGSNGTPGGASVNAAMEDGSAGPARRTRQRSTRSAATAATSGLNSTTSSTDPLASSSFARSPTGMSNGNNGNGRTFSISTGEILAANSNLSSAVHPEDSLRLAAASHTSSSARQPGTSSSTSETTNPQSRPTPSLARTTRRKDRRNADQKASISSINTVKSSLSATSAATSAPSLSHTATDPSISSAASDISSRTSEGTHATTPEHASSSLDAVHVLYAKGAQYPSYSNASIGITPSHPYPIYHQQNVASIAEGKTGPGYHHTPSPQLSGLAISAGSGRHQAQHAYVNLQGRQFDPSQVELYPHDGQDESSCSQRADFSVSNNEDSAGVRYFIDPYALPSNHPYHPSQVTTMHSTPELRQQYGGLSYASSLTAPAPLQNTSNHQQQHYATSALPPLPGTDYLLQFPNASQPHLQSSSDGYNGSGGGNGLHDGTGLDASTSSAANASTSKRASAGDTVNEDTSMMSNNHKAEGGEEEGEGVQEGEDGSHPPQPSLPTKKQKGRRPTNINLESKNHICKFSNCNWSFSRREHLRRHEKTHTQEKPFLCDIPLCGLRFSRLDNLNSHKRTHDKGKRTSQWHVAKVVGAQQASRAGSGSVLDESKDGRANAEASTSALQPAQSISQSGLDESLPPHSASGNGGSSQQNHYDMPGSSTSQRNGFPLLPLTDNNMNNGNGDNNRSTVGAEVRFAYYDPSEQQAPHSSGGHQHPQHSMAGLGGPYGNVRGYQDPFSYSAPPPPPHGIPVHSSAIAHSHLPPHPSQQQMQQHHQMQQQQHSYNHQPLPPLPPHMHDESVYTHQHRPHHQQQQHHLSPHLQASGMVPQLHEYDHGAYNTDQHRQQILQHHSRQHHEHQSQQQQQQGVPPPPTAAVASNRNSGNNKRRRNDSHRSSNPTTTANDNNNGTAMNTPIIQQPGNQMESPSHKRRQSGRKGGINA